MVLFTAGFGNTREATGSTVASTGLFAPKFWALEGVAVAIMDKAENMSSRCFMSDSLCFFSYVKIVPRALNMKESFVKDDKGDLPLPLKRAKL